MFRAHVFVFFFLTPRLFGGTFEDTRLNLFHLRQCVYDDYRSHIAAMEKAVAEQPYYPEYPFKAKLSMGTLRGTNEQLLINTKTGYNTVFPEYKVVQLMAYAQEKDGKIILAHEEHPTEEKYRRDEVTSDNEYYRRLNLQYLKAQYEEWKLARPITQTIDMQEFLMPEHRKIEIAISKQGKLLFFARLKVGNHPDQWQGESKRYAGDMPYVEVFSLDSQDGPFFYRKRVPTYFLPADLLLADPYSPSSPINQIRAKYSGYGIVDIGRVFANHEALKADVDAAKRMGLSMLMDILPDLAPNRDLNKLIVLDTAPPANARMYKARLGMTEFADLSPLLGGSVLGPVYDTLGRKFTGGQEVADATSLPEFKMSNVAPIRPLKNNRDTKISLMMATGTEFKNALQNQLLSNVNLDKFNSSISRIKDPYVKPIAPSGPDGWKYR